MRSIITGYKERKERARIEHAIKHAIFTAVTASYEHKVQSFRDLVSIENVSLIPHLLDKDVFTLACQIKTRKGLQKQFNCVIDELAIIFYGEMNYEEIRFNVDEANSAVEFFFPEKEGKQLFKLNFSEIEEYLIF